jgi:hypothetical protein
MNKKIIYLAIAMVPVLIMARMPERLSFGAPVSSSGAPDEVTCANSGCHDDSKINNGNALLRVKVGDDLTKYVPGKVYPITVKITEPGVNRFGFQVVALKNSDHLNAGEMAVTDITRTQIISNDIALQDRRYVTYTYPGTAPSAPGEGEWTMNWTAPEKNVGPVTLYIASVSANNDNTDKGDHVYTTSITLNPEDASSVEDLSGDLQSTVFFNSTSRELSVNLQLQNEKQVKCLLYNVQGRLIKNLFDERMVSTDKKMILDVPNGVYLVTLLAGQNEKTTKIVVQ